MKSFIAFAFCCALILNVVLNSSAAPPQVVSAERPQEAQVVHYHSDVQPEGYQFQLETSDGKVHQEEGQLKSTGTDQEAIVVRGSFSYVGDDGQTYAVSYLADENGFQPEGAHLPHL